MFSDEKGIFKKLMDSNITPKESMSSEVTLRDVPLEAFKVMLNFLYDGQLNDKVIDFGALLLQLLLSFSAVI